MRRGTEEKNSGISVGNQILSCNTRYFLEFVFLADAYARSKSNITQLVEVVKTSHTTVTSTISVP